MVIMQTITKRKQQPFATDSHWLNEQLQRHGQWPKSLSVPAFFSHNIPQLNLTLHAPTLVPATRSPHQGWWLSFPVEHGLFRYLASPRETTQASLPQEQPIPASTLRLRGTLQYDKLTDPHHYPASLQEQFKHQPSPKHPLYRLVFRVPKQTQKDNVWEWELPASLQTHETFSRSLEDAFQRWAGTNPTLILGYLQRPPSHAPESMQLYPVLETLPTPSPRQDMQPSSPRPRSTQIPSRTTPPPASRVLRNVIATQQTAQRWQLAPPELSRLLRRQLARVLPVTEEMFEGDQLYQSCISRTQQGQLWLSMELQPQHERIRLAFTYTHTKSVRLLTCNVDSLWAKVRWELLIQEQPEQDSPQLLMISKPLQLTDNRRQWKHLSLLTQGVFQSLHHEARQYAVGIRSQLQDRDFLTVLQRALHGQDNSSQA